METSRSKSSGGAVSGVSHHFHRSHSPVGRFCSSSSTFANRPAPGIMTRPASPTRVNLYRSVSPTPSVRFSSSPRRSIVASPAPSRAAAAPSQKKTCSCSPTTHPGSFRCSFHRSRPNYQQTASYGQSSHQLNMRRSAMTNSLVRIGTVEGDLMKRALAALIRPSLHNFRRRDNFRPRPSRLSIMSKADD